jgi:adenylate cyclase
MAIEIERKFLVINDEYKSGAKGTYYRQGYISIDNRRVVRIRVAGKKAFLAFKSLISERSRSEYEYKIPVHDALELLDKLCLEPVIEKIRYEINYDNDRWIVDEFLAENAGLVVAEIELENENQKFSKPSWLGKEVSSDPRYLNANLVVNPYKHWK